MLHKIKIKKKLRVHPMLEKMRFENNIYCGDVVKSYKIENWCRLKMDWSTVWLPTILM